MKGWVPQARQQRGIGRGSMHTRLFHERNVEEPRIDLASLCGRVLVAAVIAVRLGQRGGHCISRKPREIEGWGRDDGDHELDGRRQLKKKARLRPPKIKFFELGLGGCYLNNLVTGPVKPFALLASPLLPAPVHDKTVMLA